jgi:hypothetical protein
MACPPRVGYPICKGVGSLIGPPPLDYGAMHVDLRLRLGMTSSE